MFNLVEIVTAAGYVGIFLIIFAESGVLFGFFLPGDSLLFTAGFLASKDIIHIVPLIIVGFAGAFLGDQVGYMIGKRLGPTIFQSPRARFFHPKQIERAETFYATHGGKTLILARFMPVIRTLAPLVAGIGKMRYYQFVGYNAVGAALWAIGLPMLGYFLGNSIPDVDRYLLPIIILIVIVSLLPSVIHILRDPDMRQHIVTLFGFKRQK